MIARPFANTAKERTKEFNPSAFDAREIARIAQEAGMKWIIITAKHHEGFAMFKSAHPFNIVDGNRGPASLEALRLSPAE